MDEGAADGRDTTTTHPTNQKLRPAAPKIELEDSHLKNYLFNPHIIKVLRELPAYDLALRYLSGINGLCKAINRALGCGVLAAKLFIVMYMYGGEWTCRELSLRVKRCRQNIHKALTRLEKKGLIIRSSTHKWRVNIESYMDIAGDV